MTIFEDKFVDFFKWCSECEYEMKTGLEDPCSECLATPVRKFSTKPVNFKEKSNVKR